LRTQAQQDGYLNESWNVAIVGDAVDIDPQVLAKNGRPVNLPLG
jgi:hypothetical protein